MSTKNNSIKSNLLTLFNNGKSESEAHEEINKAPGSHKVSLNTVNNWFERFRTENNKLDDKKKSVQKPKFTDEFLINLVNENPNLNIAELANILGTSATTISTRIKKIKDSGERIDYCPKKVLKFTDEYLIDLVNENPELNAAELAEIAGASKRTILIRIKQIKDSGKSINYCPKNALKFTDEYLIDLVNENPELNAAELAEIAGASKVTILIRIKKIKDSGKSINYCHKKTLKFTDEYLIDLINNSPHLSMEKLGKTIGVSIATIRYRIKKINSNGEKVKYINKKYIPDGFDGSFTKLTDGRLINLIKENPDLSIGKLAYLANVSNATISKKIRKINKISKTPIYQWKNLPKLTDEALIDLINKNPELNTTELAELAGVSRSTLSKMINKINMGGESANYTKKSALKVSDEVLIELINKNLELNLTELAEIAGISANMISRRINQINSSGKVINYVKKKSKNTESKTS